jgi:hypothetical protein
LSRLSPGPDAVVAEPLKSQRAGPEIFNTERGNHFSGSSRAERIQIVPALVRS